MNTVSGSQHALQPGEQKNRTGGGGRDSIARVNRQDRQQVKCQVEEAVNVLNHKTGGEGSFDITDTVVSEVRKQTLTLNLHLRLPTTLYIFCSWI